MALIGAVVAIVALVGALTLLVGLMWTEVVKDWFSRKGDDE